MLPKRALPARLLVLGALAGPPPEGFRVVHEALGCVLMVGEAESDGVIPGRVECDWPDVSLERFDQVMGRWGGHDLWSNVRSSQVQRSEGPRSLVHQVHYCRGLSEREVLLWMDAVPADGGGTRYRWTRAKDVPLEPGDGRVAVPRNDGFWQAVPLTEGGVQVSYYLAYDPGGRVPSFVLGWFKVSGLMQIVEELHQALTS